VSIAQRERLSLGLRPGWLIDVHVCFPSVG
jgi:hypothetical protein